MARAGKAAYNARQAAKSGGSSKTPGTDQPETRQERDAGIVQVEANKAAAAKLGIEIPGSSGAHAPVPSREGTGSTSLYSGEEKAAREILYDIDPYDEKTRRSEMLKQAEGQISAVDAIYDRRVDSERKLGERDMNRSNTISAMTGMMGGPEATTRAGRSDARTEDRVAAVEEMRALELSRIYGKIDENVLREREAALSTQRENAKAILDEVATNAMASLNSFASQGLTWDQLEQSDPETLNNLVRQSGKDPFELRVLYESSVPGTETVFEGFKGDNFVRITQNADGTLSYNTTTAAELGIPKNIDVGTVTFDDGVYWYDKNNPVDESGSPALVRLGTRPGAKTTSDSDSPVVDESGSLLSYEEWRTSDEAKQILNAEMARQKAEKGSSAMTTASADALLKPLYDDAVRQYKKETVDPSKNYTATNIPNTIKADIVSDITQNAATLEQLYRAYPDVSSSYLSSLYNSLKKKSTSSSSSTEMSDAAIDDFIAGEEI